MSIVDLRLSFFTKFSASSIFLSRAVTWAIPMPTTMRNSNILMEYLLSLSTPTLPDWRATVLVLVYISSCQRRGLCTLLNHYQIILLRHRTSWSCIPETALPLWPWQDFRIFLAAIKQAKSLCIRSSNFFGKIFYIFSPWLSSLPSYQSFVSKWYQWWGLIASITIN